MKKLMLFLIAIIPLALLTLIQMTSNYIEKSTYVALEKVVYVDSHKTIIKDSDDDVILEYPASIYPYSAAKKELTYSSSNENIATVDENGVIRFKDFGEVTIKAISKDFDYIYDECSFFITDNKPHRVELLNSINQLTLGDSVFLQPIIIPNEALDKNVTYTSSNPLAISVTAAGKITALSSGESTITITTHNNKSYSTKIKVYVPLNSMEIEGDKFTYTTGLNTTKFPKLNFYPFDASNKEVTYSSADPNIATIDNEGNIQFLTRGTTTFTATSKEGNHSANYTVRYTGGYIDTIELAASSKNIFVSYQNGKIIPLDFTISPYNALLSNIEYISSDNNIVEIINNQAVIRGGGECFITIRANTGSGYISVKSNIFVERKLESIQVEDIVSTSNIVNLTSISTPPDSTEKIIYAINSSLAVLENNILTFKQPGNVIVSATNSDGSIKETFTITYKPSNTNFVEVNSLSFNYSVNFQDEFAFLLGANLKMGEVEFEYDTNYLEYDGNYKFKALKGGNTSISISDGNSTVLISLSISRKADDFEFTVNGENTNSILTSKETAKIDITFLPPDTTIQEIEYFSSDESVAVVNSNGLVEFLKAGKVNVTIKYASLTKIVTIESTCSKIKSIEVFKLEETEVDYQDNLLINYELKVLPTDVDLSSVTSFEISNNNVVYINGRKIYVKGGGNVDITIIAQTVEGTISSSATLNVNRYVESIDSQDVIINNKIHSIEYALLPIDHTENISFSIDSLIASINDNILTFNTTGTVKVTISSKNITKVIEVTYVSLGTTTHQIANDVTEVNINAEYGDEFIFLFEEENELVTYSGYESSDILSFKDNVFSATNGGSVTLIANKNNEIITITVSITRYAETINYTINGESYSSYVTSKRNVKIDAYVGPVGVTETTIVFTSSDESVASVDSFGLVTFHKAGVVTIYASSGFVLNKPIVIESTFGFIKTIEKFELNSTIYQENKELVPVINVFPAVDDLNTVINYETSNENVVKIVDNKLFIVGGGTVTIKAIGVTPNSTTERSVNITITRFAQTIRASDIVTKTPSVNLNYSVSPSDYTDSISVTLGSNIASYSNGIITFKAPGSTLVTLKGEYTNEKTIYATYTPESLNLVDVSKENTNVNIEYEDTFSFMFERDYGIVSYTYDETYFELSNEYIFKAIKGGTSLIKASNGNEEIVIVVNTKKYATSISTTINNTDTTYYLTSKKTANIAVEFDSADVTETEIQYISSDESVAIVNSIGLVEFLKEGRVSITIKVANLADTVLVIESSFGKVLDFELDVNDSLILSTNSYDNMPTHQLNFLSFTPSDYTYNPNDFDFSSSFENIATITGTGFIQTIEKGSSIISVTSNGITKTFNLTLLIKTKLVEFTYNSNTPISENAKVLVDTIDLNARVYPANANDTSVKFFIESGEAIIDESTGVLTLYDFNPVQIRVSTTDSNYTVSSVITITRITSPESLAIYNQENLVTNKEIQIETNYNANIYFEVVPIVENLIGPTAWDYYNIQVDITDEENILPEDENGNKILQQVTKNSVPTNEFILNIDEEKLFKYSRVSLSYSYGNSTSSSVTIYFKDLESISLSLKNEDDKNYGLAKKRVFGTYSLVNNQRVTTFNIGYQKTPSDNNDVLIWTSSDTSIATVNNGVITFYGASFEGEKTVTISAKAEYDNSLIASYQFTLVFGLNVYNETDFYNAHQSMPMVLQTTLSSGNQITDSNGNTHYEDFEDGKPFQILSNQNRDATINYNIYGNGYTLNLTNLDFPNEHSNALLGQTYYVVNFSANLYNVNIKAMNYDANKNYNRALSSGSGNTIEYSIIECYRHIWTGNFGLNVSNSIFRNVSYVAIQMGDDAQGNNYSLNLHNTIFYDLAMAAIDLQYGRLNITGFFDVYNFTKPSEFGSSFKSAVATAYSGEELKDYTYKPGSSSDDYQVNVAVIMLPKNVLPNAKPSANINNIYFGDTHEDNITGLNYKFVSATGTTKIIFTIKVTINFITPLLATSPIQPGDTVDLSKLM